VNLPCPYGDGARHGLFGDTVRFSALTEDGLISLYREFHHAGMWSKGCPIIPTEEYQMGWVCALLKELSAT
jgi:hypothetical protein